MSTGVEKFDDTFAVQVHSKILRPSLFYSHVLPEDSARVESSGQNGELPLPGAEIETLPSLSAPKTLTLFAPRPQYHLPRFSIRRGLKCPLLPDGPRFVMNPTLRMPKWKEQDDQGVLTVIWFRLLNVPS